MYNPLRIFIVEEFLCLIPSQRGWKIFSILLSSSQFLSYQREYKWGKEEALELIEDLQSYKEAVGENLFLGNLIFEKSKDQKIFVVDGQQRLTTLLLLLIACKMRSKALGLTKLEPRIQETITFMDSTTGESLGCRLIASESIREVFDDISNVSWDGRFPNVLEKKSVKRKVNKIKPIYDSFLKEVSEFDQAELSKSQVIASVICLLFISKIIRVSEMPVLPKRLNG